jgi:hypothetical protein
MLTVADETLVVKISFRSLDTMTMCVRSWPVPTTQSTLRMAGS